MFLGKLGGRSQGTYVCVESCCCDAVVTPGLRAVWAVLTWGPHAMAVRWSFLEVLVRWSGDWREGSGHRGKLRFHSPSWSGVFCNLERVGGAWANQRRRH